MGKVDGMTGPFYQSLLVLLPFGAGLVSRSCRARQWLVGRYFTWPAILSCGG